VDGPYLFKCVRHYKGIDEWEAAIKKTKGKKSKWKRPLNTPNYNHELEYVMGRDEGRREDVVLAGDDYDAGGALMEADDADAPDRCWVVVEEASVAAMR
jgi:hypothetical protein